MKVCKIIAKVLLIVGLVCAGISIFSCIGCAIGGYALSGNPGGQLQQILDQYNAQVKPADRLTLEQMASVCIVVATTCLICAVMFVGTVIVSAIGLSKLEKAKKRGDTLAIGILNCIFSSAAAGALLIVVSCLLPKDEEIEKIEEAE